MPPPPTMPASGSTPSGSRTANNAASTPSGARTPPVPLSTKPNSRCRPHNERPTRRPANAAQPQPDASSELEEASIAGIDARNLTQGPPPPDGPSPAGRAAAIAGEYAGAVGKNMADDLRDKPVLHGTDLTIGGVAGGLVAGRVSSLEKERDRLLRERARAEERYRAATGADRQFYADQVQEKSDAADALKRKADDIGRRAGAKIGLAGAGVSIVGIGYDVMHGKPLVKATVSGVGGAITAAYVGAAIGTLVPIPVLGTVLGAGVGWGAGLLMSGIIDAGYDMALPQGVKDAVENGTKPIDDALVGAGNAIGKAWDAIF